MNGLGRNAPATMLAIVLALSGILLGHYWREQSALFAYVIPGALVLFGVLTQLSMLMANQWERAVVLRFGRLQAIRGPGLFFVIPFVDSVTTWIDQRIQTTEFNAEQALTKDTVPANIDAILFWQVHDVERAALEITDYRRAILRVAQTSLREMIGASPLSALLTDRKVADQQLKEVIGRKTADWGVNAVSVEIRDVAIPRELQDAMSRQAQAEREKAARVILGSAEQEVAQKFVDAANIYAGNPIALQLRAMNIILETTKERGSTILIPTSMADSMNAGMALGVTAFAAAVSEGSAPAPQPPPTPTPVARG
jgi:regulator of protease activity HflC (stomatin/prohibitin superfamily)